MECHFDGELSKNCTESVLKPFFIEFQEAHIQRFNKNPEAMVATDYGLLMLNYYVALSIIDSDQSRLSLQEINHYYDQQDLSIYEIVYD